MIFRHGCGGACGCDCYQCNACGEGNELPETITALFEFPEGDDTADFATCARLWNGREVVFSRNVMFTPEGCAICLYQVFFCSGASLSATIRFYGIGNGVSLGFSVGPCDLFLNYVGKSVDCFQTEMEFKNTEGVRVTISPGGVPSIEPPFVPPTRPVSATVSLGFAEITGSATRNPLQCASVPSDALSSFGPFGACTGLTNTSPTVGLVALFNFSPASIAMVLTNTCPFHWQVVLTAYGQAFYTTAGGGTFRRDFGLRGQVFSVDVPTLADFQDPNAAETLHVDMHAIYGGSQTFNMLVPFSQWTPFEQFQWTQWQGNGWLPAPEVAAIAPEFSASWEIGF